MVNCFIGDARLLRGDDYSNFERLRPTTNDPIALSPSNTGTAIWICWRPVDSSTSTAPASLASHRLVVFGFALVTPALRSCPRRPPLSHRHPR